MPNKKQKKKNYNITYVKCIIFYSSFFNAVIKWINKNYEINAC